MALKKATQAVIAPNICTTDTEQTISGIKTFTSPVNASITGNASTATTTTNAITANTLETPRTISMSGAVIGTATAFDGSENISIPTSISSGTTITSPFFNGTATGALTTKVLKGVTDGAPADAGYVGEFLESFSAEATMSNTGSISVGALLSLSAGVWEVYGNATFSFSAFTNTSQQESVIAVSIGTVNNALTINQQQVITVGPSYSSVTINPAFALVTPRIIITNELNPIILVAKAPLHAGGSSVVKFVSTIKARRIR